MNAPKLKLAISCLQIRMGAISQTNINFSGSHCGVSIGEDGPSQMGLEDIAMFRSIPGSTIFYPSDAVSAERAVELAANTKGVCFIRTSRPANAVIYANNETFEVCFLEEWLDLLKSTSSFKKPLVGMFQDWAWPLVKCITHSFNRNCS